MAEKKQSLAFQFIFSIGITINNKQDFLVDFNLLVMFDRNCTSIMKSEFDKKLRKMVFLKKNGNTFPKFPRWQNPMFSQKCLTHKERQPRTLPQDLVQQNQITCCCY